MSPGLFKTHVGQTSCKCWGWLVIWQACEKRMFFLLYSSRAWIRLVISILSAWSSLVSTIAFGVEFCWKVHLQLYFFFLFSFSHWKHLMIKVDTTLLVTATHVLNKTFLNNYRNLINSPFNKFHLLGSHPVADTLMSLHEDGRFPSVSTLTSGVAWLFWVERGITEKNYRLKGWWRLMNLQRSTHKTTDHNDR